MRSKYLLLVLLVAGLALVSRSPAVMSCFAGGAVAHVQQPAPEFSITAYADDRKLSLSDLRGKVVLLYFWFPT